MKLFRTTANANTIGYEDLHKLAKRQKWAIRGLLALLIIILVGVGSLVAYKAAEGFWLKTIVISAVEIKHARAKEPSQMTTEEYICYVFGKNCRMALAVSQAENGTRQCDRIATNTNKTYDTGVFMINSIHLKRGWKVSDLLDCKKNIEYAKQIFDAQGWNPWVVYKTQSYKRFLNS